MKLARRMAEIEPFHVMELMARAKALEAQGRSIVHLEVGEPDFPTPAPILEAAQRAIAGGDVHYTPALGLPALREAVAGFYRDRYCREVAPERIVITAGASGALLLALGVLVDPGDEVLLTDPGYPCNRHFVRTLEGRPRGISVTAESNYLPTPDRVADAWSDRSRVLMVASPANPTGTVLTRDQMEALARVVDSRNGALIVDEIYHGLTYGLDAATALDAGDQVFVINSFSKYFGMTGWRLGWLVVPEDYVRPVEKLAQNLFIAPPTPAQYGALAAFTPDAMAVLEARRGEFKARRDVLLPGLERIGFRISRMPEGAFYIYADSSALAADSFALAHRLIEEAGVAATPGLDFGTYQPERHMRFAYTIAREQLEEGLARMAKLLR